MSERRGTVIDRRSGRERRRIEDVDYSLKGRIERRSGEERRSELERRGDWIRVSEWYSVCPWESQRA